VQISDAIISPPTSTASLLEGGWRPLVPRSASLPGRIGKIIGFEDCYFESERVLCTQAFSGATVSTTIDDGESPPVSTELNGETGHNCKTLKEQYRADWFWS
jgi:hypothetical protein